jgi:hypothetical protein
VSYEILDDTDFDLVEFQDEFEEEQVNTPDHKK